MLQNQSAQLEEVLKQFEQAQLVNKISLLAVGCLAFVLIQGCAILLARTAAGTRNSRFLRHLAIAFSLNATNALVSIIFILLSAALAFFALDTHRAGNALPASFSTGYAVMKSTFAGISIMISLLSNLFLFGAWDLLRKYPNQGVSKSLYTIFTIVFGSGSLMVLLINLLVTVEKTQQQLWNVMRTVDLLTSAVGILLIGWQLQKTMTPKVMQPILKATLPWMTFVTYLVWGSSQLFHEWLRWRSWYATLLLTSSLAVAVMTVIFCSLTLEEKPEYRSILVPETASEQSAAASI